MQGIYFNLYIWPVNVQNLLCVFHECAWRVERWQVDSAHVHCTITERKPWLLTDIYFIEVPAATSY